MLKSIVRGVFGLVLIVHGLIHLGIIPGGLHGSDGNTGWSGASWLLDRFLPASVIWAIGVVLVAGTVLLYLASGLGLLGAPPLKRRWKGAAIGASLLSLLLFAVTWTGLLPHPTDAIWGPVISSVLLVSLLAAWLLESTILRPTPKVVKHGGIIVYDSFYGNTGQVAQAIADQLRAEGYQAELVNVHRQRVGRLQADFLFIGSPTRFGRMTGRTRGFVEHVGQTIGVNQPVCAFDTYAMEAGKDTEHQPRYVTYGAGPRIRDLLIRNGCSRVYPSVLRCLVTGIKGPLAANALDQAREFTHQFLAAFPVPERAPQEVALRHVR
jgi:flavodoxin